MLREADDGLQTVWMPHGGVLTADQTALATSALRLRNALAPAFALHHLLVRRTGLQAVASVHDRLVVLRDGAINLGLLFRALQDAPVHRETICSDDPVFADQTDAAMWQVLRRIMQAVTPRQLIFAAGDVRLGIAAADGCFDMASGASTQGEGFAALRAQVRAGEHLSYTLGEGPQGVDGSWGLADLIRAAAAHDVATDGPGQWQAKAQHWPVQVPPDATVEALIAVLHAAQRVSDPLTLTGFGADRRPVLEGTVEPDGLLRLLLAQV